MIISTTTRPDGISCRCHRLVYSSFGFCSNRGGGLYIGELYLRKLLQQHIYMYQSWSLLRKHTPVPEILDQNEKPSDLLFRKRFLLPPGPCHCHRPVCLPNQMGNIWHQHIWNIIGLVKSTFDQSLNLG